MPGSGQSDSAPGGKRMKALVYTRYGPPDVLQLKDVEKPVPDDDQVLVKVHAASINKADWYLLTGKPLMVRLDPGGPFIPKNAILGGDIAGVVEAVGRNISQFQPGDEVYGDLSDAGMGGFAEYAMAPESLFATKPGNLSFEEAAAVPSAGITALQGIRAAGEIQPGQKVLVEGASGGVGTYALQIARSQGAEVTAVCSTGKMDLVRSIGADHVIDYSREDFTCSGQQYDFIIGVHAAHSLSDYRRVLTPTGTYVNIGGRISNIFAAMVLGPMKSKEGGQQIKGMGSTVINRDDLVLMKELIEAGKVAPVLDRVYSLEDGQEAFRYFGAGKAVGKVVVTMG